MAEQVRDVSRYVPMSLIWSYVGNSLMSILFLIGLRFAIDDVDAAISLPSDYPFLYVFVTALALHDVNALSINVLLLVSAANINSGASTAARQIFAFARDRGLPFSSCMANIDTRTEIQSNAILLSSLFAIVDIGSTTAFDASVGLQAAGRKPGVYRRCKHVVHTVPPPRCRGVGQCRAAGVLEFLTDDSARGSGELQLGGCAVRRGVGGPVWPCTIHTGGGCTSALQAVSVATSLPSVSASTL
jgi:hypothetical protein